MSDEQKRDYSKLFDDEAATQPSKSGGKYGSLFADEPEREMDGLEIASAAATTFAEGGLGIGDELGAIGGMLGSATYDLLNTDKSLADIWEDTSWDRSIGQRRSEMDRLDEQHSTISNVAFGAGLVASLAVPAATMAKAGRAAKVGIGAAEGAAYGALSGEGVEGRLEGAAIGSVLGGGITSVGVIGQKFLTKSKDEIAAIDAKEAKRAAKAQADDSYIWGDEGLGDVSEALVGRGVSSQKIETSVQKRSRGAMAGSAGRKQVVKATNLWESAKDWAHYASRGTAERVQDLTGNKRAGLLIRDSELLTQRSDQVIDEAFEEISDLQKYLTPDMQEVILDFGRKKGKGEDAARFDRQDLLNLAKTPEQRAATENYLLALDEFRALDFKGFKRAGKEYAPSATKPGKAPTDAKGKKVQLGVNDYQSPLVALKQYAKDVQQARILASRFNLSDEMLDAIKPKKGQGRTDAVIELIEEQAGLQAGRTTKKGNRRATEESKQAAALLADGLRSTMIHAKQGGEALGAIGRKLSSTALLAKPSNAVLNVVEGVTLPIYQSGFNAWRKTIPSMLAATLNKGKSEADPNWISTKEFGQSQQFMGEVSAKAQEGLGAFTDKLGAFTYKWTGVQRVNDMGAEGVANTALTFARDMVAKGDAKSLKALRNHAASEGMSNKEFAELVSDIKAGPRSEAIDSFAGRAMLAVQPRGASSMPQAYNDIPNGRVFYSMMSYMNRMHNVLRNDVGRNLSDVSKYGLNTERGRAAMKEATINATKFAALMGTANGVWDDMRKAGFDEEKRSDLLSFGEMRGADLGSAEEFVGYLAETTGNQLSSLASSGLVNKRAKEFGGNAVGIAAPPVKMGTDIGTGLFDVLTEQDPTKILRSIQTYLPVFSQADSVRRTTTGDRLFQEIAYDD